MVDEAVLVSDAHDRCNSLEWRNCDCKIVCLQEQSVGKYFTKAGELQLDALKKDVLQSFKVR